MQICDLPHSVSDNRIPWGAKLRTPSGSTSHTFGRPIKGRPAILVRDGNYKPITCVEITFSEHDLEEEMRLEAKTDDLSEIKIARVERSDDISFIKQR
jgi:uncharacterized membrane protein YcaP (DUF421 family)